MKVADVMTTDVVTAKLTTPYNLVRRAKALTASGLMSETVVSTHPAG